MDIPANDGCGSRQIAEHDRDPKIASIYEEAWRQFCQSVARHMRSMGAPPAEIAFVIGRLNQIEPMVNLRIPRDGMTPDAHTMVVSEFQELGLTYLKLLVDAWRELWAAGAG